MNRIIKIVKAAKISKIKFLSNFIEDSEWPLIIDEADPYYLSDGATLGLRNVHVFALSNVLKRPILLLGMDVAFHTVI